MIYYLISFFIHLCLLFMGVIFFHDPVATDLSMDNAVFIEMVSIPSTQDSVKEKAKLKKVAKTKTKRLKVSKKTSDKSDEPIKDDKSLIKEESVEGKELAKSDQAQESQTVTMTYAQELKLYLEQNKHYPRQAVRLKQSGVVLVKLKIGSSGVFNDLSIVKPSSFPILNKAALDLLGKLQNFKPLPKSLEHNSVFTIPIAYVMGGN